MFFQYRLSLYAGKKYCRMHSEILLTFLKLPFSIKTFVLTICKWPLKTGFTVISGRSVINYAFLLSDLPVGLPSVCKLSPITLESPFHISMKVHGLTGVQAPFKPCKPSRYLVYYGCFIFGVVGTIVRRYWCPYHVYHHAFL